MSDFTYAIEKAEASVSVEEFLQRCIDVPKFLACCQACPNYNNRWACPPFDFEPLELWRQYKTLRLYARIIIPGNRDGDALIGALREEKPKFLRELLDMEDETPNSLALVCGSCEACENCARKNGEPCRFPDTLRHSIESLGGDVGETARRYFGKEILWVKDGVAPDYLMLVGGLLLMEDAPCSN